VQRSREVQSGDAEMQHRCKDVLVQRCRDVQKGAVR